MKTLIIGLILALGVSSAIAADEYIFGGIAIDMSDPIALTTVLITSRASLGNFICTGSIIDKDIVVTAAHCVVGKKVDSLRVIFAQDVAFSFLTFAAEIPDTDPRVHQVYGALANPAYTETGNDRNDIAVIRFKGDLPVSYHPAQIIDPNAALTPGEEVILAGYGTTNPYTEGSGGQLRKATVQIEQMLGASEVVVDQSKGQGSCWGDSGGPAFVQSGSELLLWGLTDRAYPATEPTCNHAAVYTLITSFSDFILKAESSLRQQN